MNALRGTGILLRALLRRDRVSSSLWIALLVATVLGTASRYQKLFPTEAARRAFVETVRSNRALTAFGGDIQATSLGALTVFKVGSTSYCLVAVMALLIAVRHTRAEEDAGRYELVAAGVVGRAAAMTAALLATWGCSLAVGSLSAAGLIAMGLPRGGSLAFGAAIAVPGLFFGAVAVLAAQIASSARGATMLATGVLGLSYTVRFVADASGHRAWRWFSPEGWSHRVAPFDANRPASLGVALVATALVTAAAYALASRRDVGSGIVAARPGPSHGPWLVGPVSLAWRLQRGLLAGWVFGLALAGALFGALAGGMTSLVQRQSPVVQEFLRRYGSHEARDLTGAFLWLVALTVGYTVALYPALAVMRLRTEETHGTAELLLSTSVGRVRWVLSHVLVALVGTLLVLAVSGGAMAAVSHTGLVTGAHPSLRVLGAVLVQWPAVVVLAGVTTLAFGFVPRWTAAIAWAAFLFVNLFGEVLGPAMGLDWDVADAAIPFHHLPRVLADDPLHWGPVFVLLLVTAAMIALGTVAAKRRDLG